MRNLDKFIRSLPELTQADGPFCTAPALSWATSLPVFTIEMAANTRYAIPQDVGRNSAIRIERLPARSLLTIGSVSMVFPFGTTVHWMLSVSEEMDRALAQSLVKSACLATSRIGLSRLGRRTTLARIANKAYVLHWPQPEGAIQ